MAGGEADDIGRGAHGNQISELSSHGAGDHEEERMDLHGLGELDEQREDEGCGAVVGCEFGDDGADEGGERGNGEVRGWSEEVEVGGDDVGDAGCADAVGDGEAGAQKEDDVPMEFLAFVPIHQFFSGFFLVWDYEQQCRHHHLH